jgi:methionyl-tRNA formyltransferase
VLITRAIAVENKTEPEPEPGMIVHTGNEGITVACGTGELLVTSVKPEGKREMSAGEYISGYSIKVGDILGE